MYPLSCVQSMFPALSRLEVEDYVQYRAPKVVKVRLFNGTGQTRHSDLCLLAALGECPFTDFTVR